MGKCRSVNLTNEMKTKLVTLLFVGLSAGCLVGLAQNPADEKVQKLYNQPAGAAKTAAPAEAPTAVPAEPVGEILPLVQFEDAPLVDVIKTLARQASLNVIFDPRVTTLGADSKSPYPPVSIRPGERSENKNLPRHRQGPGRSRAAGHQDLSAQIQLPDQYGCCH